MNVIIYDVQFRHLIEVLDRYTDHVIFQISNMPDIERSIDIFFNLTVILNHKSLSALL